MNSRVSMKFTKEFTRKLSRSHSLIWFEFHLMEFLSHLFPQHSINFIPPMHFTLIHICLGFSFMHDANQLQKSNKNHGNQVGLFPWTKGGKQMWRNSEQPKLDWWAFQSLHHTLGSKVRKNWLRQQVKSSFKYWAPIQLLSVWIKCTIKILPRTWNPFASLSCPPFPVPSAFSFSPPALAQTGIPSGHLWKKYKDPDHNLV